jgi:hypothetical protein
MPSETVDLKFLADTSDVISALEKIPDVTKKQARAAARAIATSQTQAAKASKKAARIAQREWDEKLGKIKTASATAFGDSVNKVADLTAGLGAIGPVGAIAAVAIAGIGLAVVGSVAGTIALVSATDDLIRSNEHLNDIEGFTFDKSQIRAVDDANAAMAGLGNITSQAAAIIGVELAPVVERGSRLLLGMGLVALDAMNASAEGGRMVAKVFDELVRITIGGLVDDFLTLLRFGENIYKILGRKVPEGLSNLRQTIEDNTSASAALDWALGKVETSMGGYSERIDDIVDANYRQSESFKRATDAAEKHQKVMEGQVTALQKMISVSQKAQADQLSASEKLALGAAEQINEINRLAGEAGVLGDEAAAAARLQVEERLQRDLADLREKEAEKASKERERQVQEDFRATSERLGAYQSLTSSLGQLSQGVTDLIVKGKGEESAAAKKAAKIQFGVSKTTAIGQALIDGFLASQKAIAQFGPPPSPLGIIGLAAAGVTTAASVAGIAAQSPPSFHVGGLIGNSGPSAPDETMIRARAGEGVVTRQGVDALAQINSGVTPGFGGTVVVQTYRHRVLDLQVQDEMRSPTGALRAATRQGRRVGHKKKVA